MLSIALLCLSAKAQGHTQKGSFRPILNYVSHKQQHIAKYGKQNTNSRWNSTAITVDKAGIWNSQAGQDRTIALLSGSKRKGYFVDLAANEPVVMSNSRTLERDFGWTGICVDGNQQMLDKLVAQRTCTVVKGIVSSESGVEVEFTNPIAGGTWEDAMGGILSNSTDNTKVKPGYAKRQWSSHKEITTTLNEILDAANAPEEIDYLSLDIEGAEYPAMQNFDFTKRRFKYMTIERPNKKLRALLRSKGYVYLIDHGCFGDQLYAHEKYAAAAKQALGLTSEIFDRAVCLGSEPVFKVDGGYSGGSNPTLLLLPKGQCDMGYPQNGPMKAVPVECCGVIGEAAIASCVREHDM